MFPAPEFGCSGLILKNLEVNTNFTAVSNVPYWILNETAQSKYNSILGPRYLAVPELLISILRSKPSNRDEAPSSAELQYTWAMWMKLHASGKLLSQKCCMRKYCLQTEDWWQFPPLHRPADWIPPLLATNHLQNCHQYFACNRISVAQSFRINKCPKT